jgi:hypothetical protein
VEYIVDTTRDSVKNGLIEILTRRNGGEEIISVTGAGLGYTTADGEQLTPKQYASVANVVMQADFDKTIAELTGKVSTYELSSLKARIAHEVGLPYDLANRLTGADEKELRTDAESLSKLVSVPSKPGVPPLKSTEPASGKDDPYKSLLENLNIKGE